MDEKSPRVRGPEATTGSQYRSSVAIKDKHTCLGKGHCSQKECVNGCPQSSEPFWLWYRGSFGGLGSCFLCRRDMKTSEQRNKVTDFTLGRTALATVVWRSENRIKVTTSESFSSIRMCYSTLIFIRCHI